MTKLSIISVTTAYNDTADIRCGGPPTLGYDFYVKRIEAKKLKPHIEKCLVKYGRPNLGISVSNTDFYLPAKKIWTSKKIEECIKTINP